METVPSAIISSPRNHLITEAACYVIANSISSIGAEVLRDPLSRDAFWNGLITQALRHRRAEVQEAAAAAFSSLSELDDQTEIINR